MGILAQQLLLILEVFEPDALLVLEKKWHIQGAELTWQIEEPGTTVGLAGYCTRDLDGLRRHIGWLSVG